jgi:hypothetical protein
MHAVESSSKAETITAGNYSSRRTLKYILVFKNGRNTARPQANVVPMERNSSAHSCSLSAHTAKARRHDCDIMAKPVLLGVNGLALGRRWDQRQDAVAPRLGLVNAASLQVPRAIFVVLFFERWGVVEGSG